MRRHRARMLGLLAVLVMLGAAGGSLYWLTAARPGVTAANVAALRAGMSQAQIEAALGGPPRSTAPGGRDWSTLLYESPTPHRRELWGGDGGAALLHFDDAGRVVSVRWFPAPDTFLDRARRWLPF